MATYKKDATVELDKFRFTVVGLVCRKCGSNNISDEKKPDIEGFDYTWSCDDCGQSETHYFEIL